MNMESNNIVAAADSKAVAGTDSHRNNRHIVGAAKVVVRRWEGEAAILPLCQLVQEENPKA